MAFPQRKPNRLEHYDYSQNGAYFITLCVQDRKPILSRIPPEPVGASIARPAAPELSEIGKIVDRAIQRIPIHYPDVVVEKYVIMPNHVHLLLCKGSDIGRAMLAPTEASRTDIGRAMLAPTDVSRIVQQMKGYVTKQCGRSFWQKSYYDHIIRDDFDFQTKWSYIDENPLRWRDDTFYTENT